MLRVIGFVLMLSTFPLLSAAQNVQPREVIRQSNRQEMDNLLLRKPILSVEDTAARQATLKQINDDFKNLQVLNNQLMTSCVHEQVDFKCASELLSGIGARASRLQSSLLLPVDDSDEKKESWPEISTADQLRASLLAFDGVVTRFVNNPIFKQEKVIDAQQAASAGRDMRAIAELSRKLKKASRKLEKSSSRN